MLPRYTVSFSPMALDDVQQAVNYYEDIRTGLGGRFNKQLQATLNAIRRNAFFASVRYDDIRCAQIKKFPYLVHYHVDEGAKEVTIIAVCSAWQKPLWE